MKDFPPKEAYIFRHIEKKLREAFELWGYTEVIPSTIAFAEDLSLGIGSKLIDSMFKFQDLDGKIIALRAEATIPTVRVLTSELSPTPKPIRLYYILNVFRRVIDRPGRFREFWQAGVELIGRKDSEADAEVLTLLTEALNSLGLTNFRIDVSHAAILKEVVNELNLNPQEKEELFAIAGYKDYSRFESFLENKRCPLKLALILKKLFKCFKISDLKDVLKEAESYQAIKKALVNLLEINEAAENLGVKELFFDFALTKEIEYYSGVIFEASLPTLGFPIAGGGRYDELLKKFGEDLPATGFAIDVTECFKAIKNQSLLNSYRKTVVLEVSSLKLGGEFASKLRENGVATILESTKPIDQIKMIAKSCKANAIIKLDNDYALVINVKTGKEKKLSINEALKFILKEES
ncbi:ATP phosphoribosyltransferase regulatory subunit [Candidatus Bathyarchaeota archaeon]|nr:ATP phosphoribosyltransferase regulatory subunit [Candidatus Bathyarchaeota archaeon]